MTDPVLEYRSSLVEQFTLGAPLALDMLTGEDSLDVGLLCAVFSAAGLIADLPEPQHTQRAAISAASAKHDLAPHLAGMSWRFTPSGPSPEESAEALHRAVAAAGILAFLGEGAATQPILTGLDDYGYDAALSPERYRDVAALGQFLADALDLEIDHPARIALDPLCEEPEAPSEIALAGALRNLDALRVVFQQNTWESWKNAAYPEKLREWLRQYAPVEERLAADTGSDEPQWSYLLAEHGDREEVSLVAANDELYVQWEGDGAPPEWVYGDGLELRTADADVPTARRWLIRQPPILEFRLVWADREWVVDTNLKHRRPLIF